MAYARIIAAHGIDSVGRRGSVGSVGSVGNVLLEV